MEMARKKTTRRKIEKPRGEKKGSASYQPGKWAAINKFWKK